MQPHSQLEAVIPIPKTSESEQRRFERMVSNHSNHSVVSIKARGPNQS